MHIHSFDLVSIKSHLQLILPLHLNTVIANGFRKLCKKGRQQLKLHFGGESLTCARAFSSAVATPCSDSEAGAAPAAKRREHRDQAVQIKVGKDPNPELADVGQQMMPRNTYREEPKARPRRRRERGRARAGAAPRRGGGRRRRRSRACFVAAVAPSQNRKR